MLDLINFQLVRWRGIQTFWISNIYRLFNRKFYSFIWSCSQFWAKMMWNCICLMKRKVICAGRSHDSTVCPASDDLQRAADSDSGSYKLHSHNKTPAERQTSAAGEIHTGVSEAEAWRGQAGDSAPHRNMWTHQAEGYWWHQYILVTELKINVTVIVTTSQTVYKDI